MSTPFTEALSQLNDRALRRLLGARAFLRGYDYVRRNAVEDVEMEELSATGHVRGTEPDPYAVKLQVTPSGFSSECTCPAFGKINGHCKHVAALLIALRDQVRPKQPRPPAESQPGGAGAPNGSAPALPPLSSPGLHGGGDDALVGSGGGGSRRARRRARKLAAQRAGLVPGPPSHGGGGGGGRPGYSVEGGGGGRFSNGVDAWIAEAMPPAPKQIEYRMQVRPSMLTVSILDPDARMPLSATALLAFQAQRPTADRDALRILARHEEGGQRRVGIEVRGEDAADLLPHLKGRRVILEPQMMELRFGDDPLRPRFDLELSQDGQQVLVKASFQRAGDPRKFTTNQGGWFEGSPGWHVDAQEGWARPLDRRVSPAAIRRLARLPVISESIDALPVLIAQGLPRVALEVGADLPDLSQVADVVDIPPTFRLRAGGSLTEAQVSLRAAYEDTEIDVRADGMTPPVIVKPPKATSDDEDDVGGRGPRRVRADKRALVIRCDIAAQQEATNKLKALGLKADEDGQSFIARGDDALQFWTEAVGALPEDWDLFIPDDLVDVQVRGTSLQANARVSSGVDWLSLRLTFEAEGIAVTQDELARCLAEGRRYVRLSDGSFAKLDPEKVKAVLARQAEILATSGATGGKFPLSQAGRIQELLEQVGKANVSAETKELFKKLQDVDEIKVVKKPRNLKAQLRPYQEQGFQWLHFLHDIASGGILADDMGLGKTVQTIALLLAIKSLVEKEAKAEGKDDGKKAFKALIVAPTSVVTNWMRELDKFAPSLSHIIWHGAERKERQDELEDADIVITSYALLRRDEELLAKLDLTYAILDEAQNIKNPLSATARAAKRLKAKRRLALTGTPIENRLSEIWSIFDFVSPGLLGPLEKFEERYARPIDNGDAKAAARLRATIHPFILRRTKSEVAKDLPEKIETDQICELTGEQSALYGAVLKEVRAQVMGEVERQGLAKSHIQILAGLTRLRQAACDPRLLGLPREFKDDDSGKLVALRELIQTSIAGGHRVLVFSQFVSMLTLIRRAMEEDGVAYEYLDGSTKDREARVQSFQKDDGPPVFLISLKAGGSGLNLTAADTVIHFDPWWNPAVEDQATDRAHRIGQTKVVTTYRLIAKGTIEEKILELGGKKRELTSAVLSEDVGGAKKLTKGDLEELFKFD
ncbi:MAG: SNF2 helicase associated domain-containing protein [Labilithrix sp.]|nr:SNF2 helicase associated domain-containing protein [Labilithrix sp.]